VLYETLDPLRIVLAFNTVSRRRGAGSDFAVVGFATQNCGFELPCVGVVGEG
jgi:hypothetical protein